MYKPSPGTSSGQEKKCPKSQTIPSTYGRDGIVPWLFFKFSRGPFRVIEVKGSRRLNFELKFENILTWLYLLIFEKCA